jgi:O-antigen/teichoic acid export membrane protein
VARPPKLSGLQRAAIGTRRRRTYAASLAAGYAYTGASALVNLILIPVLANGLGKEGYGVWITVFALGQWISLAVTWLGPGIVQKIGEHFARDERESAATVAVTAAGLYGLVGLFVAAVALLMATRSRVGFLGGAVTEETKVMLLLAAAWIALQVQSQVRMNVLTAAQRLYLVHGIQTGVILLSGLSAIVLVSAGAGLPGVAGSYAGASALGFVAYRSASRRLISMAPGARRFQPELLRQLMRTTSPYALSGAGWILLSSDILLLALLTNPAQVAEYGIAYKVVEAVLQLIWRVSDTTQPYVVEFDVLNDRLGLQRLYFRTLEVSLALGVAAAAFLFFLGDRLLVVWVGEAQAADLAITRLLCGYLLLQTIVHANVIFPFSAARMGSISKLQLIEGASKVAMAVTLENMIGVEGVPLASIIAIGLFSLWYVPTFTLRWLGLDAIRVLYRAARVVVPIGLATATAAWLGLEAFSAADAGTLAVGTLLTGIGFVVGAGAALALRERPE